MARFSLTARLFSACSDVVPSLFSWCSRGENCRAGVGSKIVGVSKHAINATLPRTLHTGTAGVWLHVFLSFRELV